MRGGSLRRFQVYIPSKHRGPVATNKQGGGSVWRWQQDWVSLPFFGDYQTIPQRGKGWKTDMAKTLLKETGRGLERTLSERSLGEIPRGIKRGAKKAVKREVSRRVHKGLDDIFE